MFVYKKINYVLLEEALNTLLKDDHIQKRRYGQVDMVRKKLLDRVRSQLADLGFSKEMRQGYLKGDPAAEKMLTDLLPELLSQRKLRSVLLQHKRKEYASALETLEAHLLDKAQIGFRKESGLSAKVWLGFYNSTSASTPETLNTIANCLKLNETEAAEFLALTIPEILTVNDPLKREVHFRRRETGMAILEFLDYAYVGKDAWEAFYPIPGETDSEKEEESEKKEPRNTSQETLLKLLIGFGLEESDARALLALVDSDFILLRDLVFLASIRMGYNHPDLLPEILDFFAGDEEGRIRYANPYARNI